MLLYIYLNSVRKLTVFGVGEELAKMAKEKKKNIILSFSFCVRAAVLFFLHRTIFPFLGNFELGWCNMSKMIFTRTEYKNEIALHFYFFLFSFFTTKIIYFCFAVRDAWRNLMRNRTQSARERFLHKYICIYGREREWVRKQRIIKWKREREKWNERSGKMNDYIKRNQGKLYGTV